MRKAGRKFRAGPVGFDKDGFKSEVDDDDQYEYVFQEEVKPTDSYYDVYKDTFVTAKSKKLNRSGFTVNKRNDRRQPLKKNKPEENKIENVQNGGFFKNGGFSGNVNPGNNQMQNRWNTNQQQQQQQQQQNTVKNVVNSNRLTGNQIPNLGNNNRNDRLRQPMRNNQQQNSVNHQIPNRAGNNNRSPMNQPRRRSNNQV